MSFDDLVNKNRHGRQDADRGPDEATLQHARATLDAALGQTGLAAAMALASHGVPPVPVGHIKRRFGFEYPEQTSHAWKFPGGLHLLRDGTWWRVGSAAASAENAPPPLLRWVLDDDPADAGSILAPQEQLTGDVLQDARPATGDVPCGSFATAPGRAAATLDFSVLEGVARISEGAGCERSVPFDEWAAAAVAALIDAR